MFVIIKISGLGLRSATPNNQGVLLVLSDNFSLYEDVIARWESITVNLVNDMQFADNNTKVLFIKNLLDELEKKVWIQWRMSYEAEYDALVNIADDPQNVLSQIRCIILMEDPYQGSTDEKNPTYLNLERLICNEIKNMFQYMNDYKTLAAKSGRMFINPKLSDKFFKKLPMIIGAEIE